MKTSLIMLLAFIVHTNIHTISCSFSFTSCNVTDSCWFQTPDCTENNRKSCLSSVKWNMDADGINIELEAVVTDLKPNLPYYVALGFSFNRRMDDDTVFECIQSENGRGIVQLSFNDNTKNELIPQASSVMLGNTSSFLIDGTLSCSGKLLLDSRKLVDQTNLYKVHDLEARSYHLLLARGNADKYSLQKSIHSYNDNAQFPWTSEAQVTFCRSNSSCKQTVMLTEMEQSNVPRYWRFRIAVIHGSVLVFAWWILGSSAILIARYFKPIVSKGTLPGSAVWFQLHRGMFMLSVVLQLLAVFFIFYQAGWVWYECSYTCTSDSFTKKMHAITGFAATVLAVFQLFFASLRPAPDSSRRPWFNWGHWLIGMTAWTLASVTIVLALPLGKTGLKTFYGHIPNWIMGGYISFFILCFALLERVTSMSILTGNTSDKNASTTVAVASPNISDNTQQPTERDTFFRARLFVFFAHLAVSLAVYITITTMLVRILQIQSP